MLYSNDRIRQDPLFCSFTPSVSATSPGRWQPMYAAKVYVRSVDGRVRSTRTILFFSTGVIGVRRKYGDIEGASSVFV